MKELMLRKKHLKEKEQVASQAIGEMFKLGNPSTNTRKILLSFLVQLAVDTEYPLELPVSVLISGR